MTEANLRRLSLGLAAALVAALVGVAVLWLDRDDAPGAAPADGTSDGASGAQADPSDLVTAGTDAELAARSAVERMTTYDWATVDADFGWVDDAGTEKFRSYFVGASRDAKQAIVALKASATGTVVDSAPKVLDPENVRVLLFVDQEIRAEKQQGSKLDQPRVTMDMVLVDGRWLVDAVDVNDLLG